MHRRYAGPQVLIFAALWVGLMLIGPKRLFRDPGTFWHVAIGQKILQSRHLIQHDTFSFTREGTPWVSQFWLCQCAMAGLYRIGGWDSLLLATATLLAAVYAWAASRLMRSGLSAIYTVLFLVLALAASSHQFHVRPSIVTIALLGFTFALMVDVDVGRRRLVHLWWCVPVFVLWANIHGGVLGGLGTLGLVSLGWCAAAFIGYPSPVRSARDAAQLAALVAACGAACFATPYGTDVPKLWLEILQLPLPDLVQEHAPLLHSGASGWMVLLFATIYVVILAGVFPGKPRVTWLLPLVWFALAYTRIRHAPLFAIVALVALADLLPQTGWAHWLAKRGFFRFCEKRTTDRLGQRVGLLVLPAALVGLALALQVADVPAPVVGDGWVQLDPGYWPVELVPKLHSLEPAGAGKVRLINDMLFGGFLVFHTPNLQVFVDDRCELYGRDFLLEYARVMWSDPTRIDEWAQEYGARYALVQTDSVADRYLSESPNWTTLEGTAAGTLYQFMTETK